MSDTERGASLTHGPAPCAERSALVEREEELIIENGRYRVVVAHDGAAKREHLRAALSRSGWFEVVGEAKTGNDLVALVAELQPDLVVVRLLLPGGNGLAVLPQIREASPQSVVVLQSVTPSEELESIASARGADICVQEETAPATTVERLLRLMSRLEWLRTVGNSQRVERFTCRG